MRFGKLKYAGIIVAIIGAVILAALGAVYLWVTVRPGAFSNVDLGAVVPYAILGTVMLVGGLAAYSFVEE